MGDATETQVSRFMELTGDGLRRRFLIAVPRPHLRTLLARRLDEMALGPEPAADSDPRLLGLRRRLEAAAMTDAQQRAAQEAMAAVVRRLGLRTSGAPRIEPLATPPDGDLVLHVEVETLPEAEPPDPATLRIETLVARPDPAETERALAALAASRAEWVELPPGSRAEAGDVVLCDIEAELLPPVNRLPHPGLEGAAPGVLPDGWTYGHNGSGLAAEVLAVETDAAPPFLRLRIHGTAAKDGQTYVMFHREGAVPAAPGSTWAGSIALRQAAAPVGLRGGKLRLDTKPSSGKQTLRRKDSALSVAAGFARIFVSDTLAEAATGSVRLAVLFDHAAGPVDFCMDLALPRLVEGLDLGADQALPLPEFGGAGRRIETDAPDPLGLVPHLLGITADEAREATLALPATLDDRSLAGRTARFVARATAVQRRRVPAVDGALAAAMGFEGLDALRDWAARRVAARHAELAALQARRAALDALLDAAPAMPLPGDAVRAELGAIWPRLAAEAEARGTAPDQAAAQALAARRVKLGLLLSALARRHDLVPSDSDLQAAAAALRDATPEALQARALEDRVVAFLLDRAQVTRREADAAELAAALR
jgi:FKBP-type peptidyl-prolyl cis-trans isomerase (trigger factor)